MKKKYNLFSKSFSQLILLFICLILIKSSNAKEISTSIKISNSENEYSGYSLVLNEECLNLDSNIWTVCEKGPSYWNIEAGLYPSFQYNGILSDYMHLKLIHCMDLRLLLSKPRKHMEMAYSNVKQDLKEAMHHGQPFGWPPLMQVRTLKIIMK